MHLPDPKIGELFHAGTGDTKIQPRREGHDRLFYCFMLVIHAYSIPKVAQGWLLKLHINFPHIHNHNISTKSNTIWKQI